MADAPAADPPAAIQQQGPAADQQPAAAQQPAAPRSRIPVPHVNPFCQAIGETSGDIRHWLLTFDAYLDCVNRNQVQNARLQDLDKIALLISHLGQEGLRSFGGTPEYAARNAGTYDALKQHVITHFRRAPSRFKARHDFYTRRQEPGESIKDFVTALRALVVDCAFEEVQQPRVIDDHIMTQLVCHTSDEMAKKELFASRQQMTLQDVIAHLSASEAASLDTKALQSRSKRRNGSRILQTETSSSGTACRFHQTESSGTTLP